MMDDLNTTVDKLDMARLKAESLKRDIFNGPGGADNARLDDLRELGKVAKEIERLQLLINAG